MDPTPAVDELVELLGAAQSAHADDWQAYWPYSTVKFVADCGAEVLTLEVDPGSESVRVHVERDGVVTMDLDLSEVTRIDVERLHGQEALRLAFRSGSVPTVHLQVRPTVALIARLGAQPWEGGGA